MKDHRTSNLNKGRPSWKTARDNDLFAFTVRSRIAQTFRNNPVGGRAAELLGTCSLQLTGAKTFEILLVYLYNVHTLNTNFEPASGSGPLPIDLLKISDLEVVHAIARWRETHPHAPRRTLRRFLSFVRFKALTVRDLCNLEQHYPSLIPETLAIVKHLVSPITHRLPEWCNQDAPKMNLL